MDDTVLSCGGLIAALSSTSAPVLTLTLFCGAPWFGPYSEIAKWLHNVSGGLSARGLARLRRREDVVANAILGTRTRQFRWKEAAYRRNDTGAFLYETTRREIWNIGDDLLLPEIASSIASELTPADIVVLPLGVGRHVDHLIARRAIEPLNLPRVLYYPDIPYTQLFPDDIQSLTRGLVSHGYTVSPAHMQSWITAIDAYATQIPMLEKAAGPLPALIESYVASGLCLYCRATPTLPAFDHPAFSRQ